MEPGPGLRPATRVVHAGDFQGGPDGALVPPIPMSAVYRHGNALDFHYGREHNQGWERLESALEELEKARWVLAFGSATAAMAAVLERRGRGGKVVLARDAYQGTRARLRQLAEAGRCRLELVDATDPAAVERACRGAQLLILESLGNPLLSVPDLRACCGLARTEGALSLVDNTLATPLLVQPLALGADLVLHSATKYIGGHSDLILGLLGGRDPELLRELREERTDAGAIPGQLECWLALRGLRTLELRLRRQMESAAALADRLKTLPGVLQVHYPGLLEHPQHELARAQMEGGFGAIVSVELDADAETAERFCSATRIWTNATSLGAVESLLERRARWPEEGHLPAGLIRLSVGIEDPRDLFEDLLSALRQAGVGTTRRAGEGQLRAG